MSMYKKIIGVIGTPRSGVSWTGQIFDSCLETLFRMQPFYSWAFRDKVHPRTTSEDFYKFFDELYLSNDDYILQLERRSEGVYPVFDKKEGPLEVMVYKESMFHYLVPFLLEKVRDILIVAVIRNPIDALTSFYNAPRECPEGIDIQKEWYFAPNRNQFYPEQYWGYLKWKEFINMLYCIKQKYPDRVYIQKYEELNRNPEEMTKNMLSFCGLHFDKQTEQFLYDCKHKYVDDPYSVFRKEGVRQKNKKELPQNIIDSIESDLETFEYAKYFGY